MCIPVDSMLWALVARIRDEGYLASERDVRALLRSGCPAKRVREVLASQGSGRSERAFLEALAVLERVASVA